MNKKLFYIPLCVLLSLLLITAAMLAFLTIKGYGLSVGRLLVTEDGTQLLIVDQTPIQLSDQSKRTNLFEAFQTGDLLLVVHDGVEETYPARSGAYAAFRLKRGRIEDIPEDILSTLVELGWLKK